MALGAQVYVVLQLVGFARSVGVAGRGGRSAALDDRAAQWYAVDHAGGVRATHARPGGRRVMAVQATLRTAIPTPKHTGCLAFSPDGRWLGVAGLDDKQVSVVEVATGRQRFSVRHGSWLHPDVHTVAFSADGRWLVTGGGDRVARVWDADTGKRLREIRQKLSKGNPGAGYPKLQGVAFSPDGRLLATGSADCTGRIFDVASGQELLRVIDGPGVGEVAFSPDGRRLATSGKVTRILDAATGEELPGVLHDFCGRVAFSPDGRRLATSGTETGRHSESARIWDADTGQEQLKVHHDGAFGYATHHSCRSFTHQSSWPAVDHVWLSPPGSADRLRGDLLQRAAAGRRR
jgi:WD40 repeat protein